METFFCNGYDDMKNVEKWGGKSGRETTTHIETSNEISKCITNFNKIYKIKFKYVITWIKSFFFSFDCIKNFDVLYMSILNT